MESNKRIAAIRARMAQEDTTNTGPWGNILPHLSKGNVIPILSNTFRIEQIFRELGSEGESTVVEQLIAEWANEIGYPMRETHNLAHVAQYYLVEQNDDPNARTKIVDFLKMFLLSLASDDPAYASLASRLKSQIQELRFSDIVKELDYPRFPSTSDDPLRILARFPLPIYITTSQSNFIERALQAEGKDPCTQICFWSGDISNIRKEHRIDQAFHPSVTNPLVYHLYGLEDYPQTLVLSEDDYLNFLINVMADTNNSNPIVPLYVRRALTESHLLLIGYRLSAWDFRVLFRFILKFRQYGFSPRGMLIQLKKNDREFSNEKTLNYLGRYFGKNMFDIELTDAEVFIQKLWTAWNAYRQNQS
jgi:hypothetical protein